MNSTNNISFRQLRVLCIIGAGLPAYHDVQSNSDRVQRFSTLRSLDYLDLIDFSEGRANAQCSLTENGRVLYEAIKADLSALFNGRAAVAPWPCRGKEIKELPPTAGMTCHSDGFQIWMKTVVGGYDADFVARHFEDLLRRYRAGESALAAREAMIESAEFSEQWKKYQEKIKASGSPAS
jgi:hypothetical protein